LSFGKGFIVKKFFILFSAMLLINTGFSFSQDSFTLDNALKDISEYFNGTIPAKSKIVVLNINSDNARLANYIIEELTIQIVNGENFTVVDRRHLEELQQELNFQMSGEVSDETAQSIGKKLGASGIISGAISKMGNMYRLRVQSIEVETARIQGLKNYILTNEPVLNALNGLRSPIASERKFIALDNAIEDLGKYLTARIPPNSKILIANITSDIAALSNYIIDAFTAYAVNKSTLVVVDRRNLELLQQELNFQMSGEISDDTALSIGQKLGAQYIVFGKIEPLGGMFRLRIQVIAVETAEIEGMKSAVIKRDNILNAMAGEQSEIRYVGEDWKYKFLHAGLRPGFSVHFYDTSGTRFSGTEAEIWYSADIAAFIAFQIHRHFSVQTEIMFTSDAMNITKTLPKYDEYDNFLYNYNTTYNFSSANLLVPVLGTVTWRPSIFSIECLAGIYFNVPVSEMKISDSFSGETEETGGVSAPPGIAGGVSFGVKLGQGLLFLDLRYLADFANTKIEHPSFAGDIYRRGMASAGIGYKMSFFSLNRRR
jgi:TolB-like protein